MHRLYSYLPMNILSALSRLPDNIKSKACELRLRQGGALSVSTYSKNLFISPLGKIALSPEDSYICGADDILSLVARLTEGSVYRYMSTINSGYIVTREGIRVGIAGESIYTNGKISSVSDFSSLNIRLPHDADNSGDTVLRFIAQNPNTSVLIFSPAGYGKTTVIRAVAKGLASGKFSSAKRVSVIDERGEILPNGNIGLADRFLGYSKPDGIEIAVRLFSPEYIICDEIGLFDDTRAILSVQNSGVPFIATTHGKSLEEILRRPNIKELIDHNVFQAFAVLEKSGDGCITVFEELKR